MQIRFKQQFIYCYYSSMNTFSDVKNLLLIFGGRSCEHAVSVTSARSLLEGVGEVPYRIRLLGIAETGEWRWSNEDTIDSLVKDGKVNINAGVPVLPDLNRPGHLIDTSSGALLGFKVDVIFPLLHGPHGEDGTIQGLFEMYGVPYVGCGVLASACGMDKLYSKLLFADAGIPQADFVEVRRSAWQQDPLSIIAVVNQKLCYPVFIKPARMGSSVGISRVNSDDELKAGIEHALEFDHKVLLENGFEGLLEVECGLLGNEQPQASVVGEIRSEAEFYDYRSKYIDDTSRPIIPAPISAVASEKVQALAIRAFKALDATGLARADFFVDPETNEAWINEINTLPGFTPISMYPKLWQASGLPYAQLVAKLISLAIEQFTADKLLKSSYSTP